MRYFLILGLLLYTFSNQLLAQTNTFPTDGSVGIGTTSPATKLNVNGDQLNNRISQSGGTYTEFAQRTWSGSAGILFSAYASDTYVDGGLPAVGNTKYKFDPSIFGSSTHGAKMIYADHSSIGFYISPASTGAGTDVNWGSPILWLKRGGNIGIGTTSPNELMHLKSTSTSPKARIEATASYTNYESQSISSYRLQNYSGLFDFNVHPYSSSQAANFRFFRSTNTTGLKTVDLCRGDNTSSVAVRLAVNGNSFFNGGNVGIGTSTPDYKLDVLGTVRAQEVKVATGWSDFVFDSDYNLPTLQEVENYIDQNGHLPDIPSAEEVETNGISLGEMDAKLLQKIEELTLYVIEQSTNTKSLNSRLEFLEKENKELRKLLNLIENEQ